MEVKGRKLEEVMTRIAEASEKLKELPIEPEKTYVYFLGATGSGKSELISRLIRYRCSISDTPQRENGYELCT